jgi:hypothetical protein
MPSLVADKTPVIELIDNSFFFHNKLFILIFVVGLYRLFHNIFF